jgi:hypothetical protein
MNYFRCHHLAVDIPQRHEVTKESQTLETVDYQFSFSFIYFIFIQFILLTIHTIHICH